MKKLLCALTLILITQTLLAKEAPLFKIEKSYNPENIMVVSAFVDDACHFEGREFPEIEIYWLLGGNFKKTPHPMILSKVKKRVDFLPLQDQDYFEVVMNDLSEVRHDLPESVVKVTARLDENNECKVVPVITLGPSHNNRDLIIDSIFSEVKTVLGAPVGIKSLELRGKDLTTGKELKAKYRAR